MQLSNITQAEFNAYCKVRNALARERRKELNDQKRAKERAYKREYMREYRARKKDSKEIC